jgi:nicotinate-nucleotide--dimethylbenzimidazole phosphoribosyltransferase
MALRIALGARCGGVSDRIAETVARIGALDAAVASAARERQAQLTKPAGSLGVLEELAIQIAGITGQVVPRLSRRSVFVLAADHGVTAEGVSAYPSAVTAQMVGNFLAGGGAINVLARAAGVRVRVVDIGVDANLELNAALIERKIRRGTGNLARERAMSLPEARAAIETGIALVEDEIAAGLDVVLTGEMGIGNTTAASALVAAFTGTPAIEVTGRGTGIDDPTWRRKVATIERALLLHRPAALPPLEVLARLGGFEIAGLVGVILAGAAHRRPVIVDGFIAGAAALVATRVAPASRQYLIAAHRSAEVGHLVVLRELGLRPLLDLGLRLGEGTGAVLALGLVEAALRLHAEMATFEGAAVSRGR